MEGKESSFKELSKICPKQNIPYLIKLNQFNKKINNKNYYIRLGLTSTNNLNIEYFIEDDQSGTFHKASLNINELHKLNKAFESKKNIDEIYNDIYELLQKDNFDIKSPSNSDTSLIITLIYNNENINITLNKEKISFINEYNFEVNEFINKLYNEVLTLKKLLKNSSNIKNNNNEVSQEMKLLMKENINILNKLEKLEKENINQQNEINNLKKTISELKNKSNSTKTSSRNYLRKQDIINNMNNINSNDESGDEISTNNHPYYNYIPSYYNNSYYYYQDYINNINNSDIQGIDDYIHNYDYYYNNDDDCFSNNYESESTVYNGVDNQNYYNNDENNSYNNYSYYNPYNQNIINNNNINNTQYKKNENISNINESVSKLTYKEFNQKYKTNYKDNKIKKLDLGSKKLGNIILTEIPKYDFCQIIKLYLCDNDITNINDLILWNNPNLEKIYFSNNKIKDISILAQINFGKLETLYLDNNFINDINILSKVKFPYLCKLSLHNNQIKDISVLENVNFKNLLFLSLHDNNISDISVFKKVLFPNLETLYLNNNNINDLSCFDNISNFKLKQLYLYDNGNINHNKFKNTIYYLRKNIEDFII